MTMKQFKLFLCILCTSLLGACISEPTPSDTNHVVGRILTRSSNAEEIVSEGQTALFNIFKESKAIIENQIFTFEGERWNGEKEITWTDDIPSATLTAFHPAQNGDKLITESLYTENGLIDVKIAKTTITNDTEIHLDFNHLFSKLTFNIQAPLKKNMVTISLTTPKVTGISSNGNLSISDTEVYTTTLASNNEGTYTFLIPSLEDCPLTLSLTLKDKEQSLSHSLKHTFESGKQYECNIKDREKPGILTPQEFIDFSQLYNKSGEKDFSMYGELQEDGRWLFRLLADIDFFNINTKDLLPIGLGTSKTFSSIFDGQGYTISNLTIPDKGINNNVEKEYSGLFGYIGENSIVKNIHLVNVETIDNPTCTNVGGLVGRNEGIIQDCSVQNSNLKSASSGYIGGICAVMVSSGYIINCKSLENTFISSSSCQIGGIIGGYSGKVLNCYAYNNNFNLVEGSYAGGISGCVSRSEKLEIANCYVRHTRTQENWGAILGSSESNKFTFDNLFHNGGNIIANIGKDYPNVYKYSQFSVEEKHISILLNEWIKNTGKTKYQDLTFKNWTIYTGGTSNYAIFAE